ncbi:MAG: DUF3667 domain-containing protein [Chthoniobacterales bacterium]
MPDESTDLILGDAVAAAAEEIGPRRRFFRRRKKNERPALTHCENCGAALVGEYCAQCGQHAIDYRRSLLRVLIDAADSFLNWDTKFLKSVGVLLAKPWKLTNDFNAGRRARYVHPLRLYLLASIGFFLIAKLVNLTPQGRVELKPEDRAELNAALGKLAAPDSPLTAEQRAKIEAARTRWSGTAGPLEADDRVELENALRKLPRWSPKRELKPKERAKLDAALDRIPETTPKPAGPNPEDKPADKSAAGPAASPKLINISTNWGKTKTPFATWMETRIKEKVGEDGTKAKLFLGTLRGNIPTMMLCCIPLFAFVLKVLYFRQRRFYVEHLVYALHIHTFAYLSVVLITLIGMAAARWSDSARVLVVVFLSCLVVVQVFLSIRRVYGQRWFFTALKFVLGGFAYLLILISAVGTTAFVTLLLP